uniref:Uncharacterized protein n=1 Tax=Anopheles maculatus TaxID=74869 RepID=A0A182SR72_9DIPT
MGRSSWTALTSSSSVVAHRQSHCGASFRGNSSNSRRNHGRLSVQVQVQGRAAATPAARRPRSLTAPSRRFARSHRKEEIAISRRPAGAAVVVARDPRSIHRHRRHYGVIWPHRQPKEKSEWVPAIR